MIVFENVEKIFSDGYKALANINLHIQEGELVTLIGPSGCGKTTTMKMINRLIEPTSGTITVNGENVQDKNPVELRRNIGYVIQQIGLLPHMTIAENISLVPKLKGWEAEKYTKRVDELLDLVGLDPTVYRDRFPYELSGGQQQRVGVVRALAAEPPIVLMDEPFSALDPISREQLQDELVRLQETIKKTIVFVTHDMDEALKIADRIAIMNEGEIVQFDTPEKILRHPANEFVRSFIGENRLASSAEPIASDLMMTNVVTAKPNKGLAASLKLMINKHVDSLLICDSNQQLLGIVPLKRLEEQIHNEDLVLQDIMKSELITASLDDSYQSVAEIFANEDVPYIPVVTDRKLVGLITRSSMIRGLANFSSPTASQGVTTHE